MWGKMKPLCTVSGNVNWCNRYGNCMKIPQKKLKIELPCGPAIALLSTKPKETKTGSQRGICIPCSLQHYSPQPSYGQGRNRTGSILKAGLHLGPDVDFELYAQYLWK